MGDVASTFSGATLAFTPSPTRCARQTSLKGQPSRRAFRRACGVRSRIPSRWISSSAHGDIHQDRNQRGGFDGCVPAVDVVGGISLGYAECLRLSQGFVEREALLHLAQDHVGGRVENSMKALQVNRGELVEQGENWDAVHDRGFEQEPFSACGGQIAQLAVGMDDRTFVGGDGVGSVLERGADVVDGGLAGFDVERCGFEEDIGAGGGEPFADVLGGGKACAKNRLRFRRFAGVGARATSRVGHGGRVHAIRIGDPSQTARGDASDEVSDPVTVAKLLRAVFEKTD